MILIAKALNKDTLKFNGFYKGNKVTQILATNKTFNEGSTYMLQIDSLEISDTNMIADVLKIKEIN